MAALNKNDAQLNQDYGVTIGSLAGVPVLAPDGGVKDTKAYNLVYSNSTKSFKLTEVAAAPAG